MSKIKNDALDQYGAESFEQQHFGTAGAEGVKLTDPCFVGEYTVHVKLASENSKYYMTIIGYNILQ